MNTHDALPYKMTQQGPRRDVTWWAGVVRGVTSASPPPPTRVNKWRHEQSRLTDAEQNTVRVELIKTETRTQCTTRMQMGVVPLGRLAAGQVVQRRCLCCGPSLVSAFVTGTQRGRCLTITAISDSLARVLTFARVENVQNTQKTICSKIIVDS